LPAQASRYALAFAGRDSRAKNVPLERFFDALHFKRAKRKGHCICSVLFLLVRLPAQASRYALAFAGRDSRAKNVPLERFLNALHFKRAGYGRHQVSSAFFVWCACLLKLRAAHLLSQDAGNEPVARFGAQFHWNVFLTHSTSSARGRRAARSFWWEIRT